MLLMSTADLIFDPNVGQRNIDRRSAPVANCLTPSPGRLQYKLYDNSIQANVRDAMTLPAVSPPLLGWLALILSFGPLSAYAASPTVELNGTTVVGTSQRFTNNVTVEFFGGTYLNKVRNEITHGCYGPVFM